MFCKVFRFLIVAASVLSATSAARSAESWDVTLPRGETREISFTTDEGTWMSVDVSPDGGWIVFDLLGHVYRMPATGGDAVALTQDSGIAVNFHPRISPDGSEIAFVSDRGGQENLWVMNANGGDARIIHSDMDARAAEPAWSPDGDRIAVTLRKKTMAGFYRIEDEIWSFPRGGGVGEALVQFGASQEAAPARVGFWSGNDRAQWPSYTPDGRQLYFHSATFNGADRRLRRIDIESGRIDSVTLSNAGHAACCGRSAYPAHMLDVAPEVSPDGRWLAYARMLPGGRTTYRGKERIGRTTLWIRNLETGEERPLMDPIANTLAEQHPSWQTRVLPGYDWTPDSKSIVISQGGKIRRVSLKTGRVETIPFQADVKRTLSEQARGRAPIEAEFSPRVFNHASLSPQGDQLAFEAVGRIYIKTLPDGAPQPLADEAEGVFQAMPSWSPDGRRIAYTTWDGQKGRIKTASPDGGDVKTLTRETGRYMRPIWSVDGTQIYFTVWPPALSFDWRSAHWRLARTPSNGGAIEMLSDPVLPPVYTLRSDGQYSYFNDHKLIYARIGKDVSHSIPTPRAARVVPSPDDQWFAVEQAYDVYLLANPTARGGAAPKMLDALAGGVRLSKAGGYDVKWRDTETIEFVTAKSFVQYNVTTKERSETPIGLRLKRDVAPGAIALTNARIITLDTDLNVVRRGNVVVRNGRISCIGDCDVDGVDERKDLRGKTIIPGWVETHAHHLNISATDGGAGVISPKRASSAAYLAYGVTTAFDPFASYRISFGVGELINAGRLIGPRTYSTGTALTCGPLSPIRNIDSLQEARNQINRLADLGVISIKDYKLCTRTQRSWIAEASRERSLSMTSEASDMNYLIGLVLTGHAGFEHPIIVAPTYSDIGRFFGRAGAHYSGQLQLSDYPTGNAIEYWFSKKDLYTDDKVMRFAPWRDIAARRTYVKKPLADYTFPTHAETAADIKRAGGYIGIGAHGEQPGLGTHWEVWTHAQALTPMEALQAASYDGAHFLGLENDLGSLEAGKIADLVILNENPLDDIRNTADIGYVMKDGRLYDAGSLDEIWPREKAFGPTPWTHKEMKRTDLLPDDHWEP